MSSIIILANYNYLEDNIRSRVKVSKHIVGLAIHDNIVISRRISPCWRVLDSLGLVPSGIESKLPSSVHFGDEVYSILLSFSILSMSHNHVQFHQILKDFIFLSHMIVITTLENKSRGYHIYLGLEISFPC